MKENRRSVMKTMGQIRPVTCLSVLVLSAVTSLLWLMQSNEHPLPSFQPRVASGDEEVSEVSTVAIRGKVAAASSPLPSFQSRVAKSGDEDVSKVSTVDSASSPLPSFQSRVAKSGDEEVSKVSTVDSNRGKVAAASSAVASTSSSASSTPKVTVGDLPEKDYGLGHMWNCSKNDYVGKNLAPQDQRKKLIFVHVFKTAGSTLRTLLRQYSTKCHAGLSVVVRCNGWLGPQPSTNGELTWQAKHKRFGTQHQCLMKEHDYRKPKEGQKVPDAVTDKFIQKETDMIVGHFPMGVHHGFINTESKSNPEYQYITFFRDAASRYVSAFVFKNADFGRQYSAEEAVRHMKFEVQTMVRKGVYSDGYSTYLLLPKQKTELLTVESRVRQIRQNMIDFNVMIGIVEKMGTSLDLLGHLIDKDREARTLLDALDPRIPREKTITENQSHLSTTALVKMLKEDKSFVPVLEEYLKYDVAIYEFAVKMHERQVKATLGSQAIASTTK